MRDRVASPEAVQVVDGGDRACGELLLVLAARVRDMAPGSLLRLVATDPAAAVDLPAWCHLTGHRYVGAGWQPDGRPHHDLQTAADPRPTRPGQPWRLDPSPSSTPTRRRDPHP